MESQIDAEKTGFKINHKGTKSTKKTINIETQNFCPYGSCGKHGIVGIRVGEKHEHKPPTRAMLFVFSVLCLRSLIFS